MDWDYSDSDLKLRLFSVVELLGLSVMLCVMVLVWLDLLVWWTVPLIFAAWISLLLITLAWCLNAS